MSIQNRIQNVTCITTTHSTGMGVLSCEEICNQNFAKEVEVGRGVKGGRVVYTIFLEGSK